MSGWFIKVKIFFGMDFVVGRNCVFMLVIGKIVFVMCCFDIKNYFLFWIFGGFYF